MKTLRLIFAFFTNIKIELWLQKSSSISFEIMWFEYVTMCNKYKNFLAKKKAKAWQYMNTDETSLIRFLILILIVVIVGFSSILYKHNNHSNYLKLFFCFDLLSHWFVSNFVAIQEKSSISRFHPPGFKLCRSKVLFNTRVIQILH